MKPFFTSIALIVPLCLTGQDNPHEFSIKFKEIQSPNTIIGKWTFSGDWKGYMGIALEIKEKEYKYWFYSDAESNPEVKYPITGTWELTKGVLVLNTTADVHLYANEWVLAESNGKIGLIAPENIKVLIWQQSKPESRMLFKVSDATSWPLLNKE